MKSLFRFFKVKFFGGFRLLSPPLFYLILIQAFFIACSAVMIVLDPRTLSTGASPWLKPIIFDSSVIVYAASMVFALSKLARPVNLNISKQVSASLFIVTGFIFIQAIRGVRTIFSVNDPINSTIFGIFGVAIAWNTYLLIRTARIYADPKSPQVLPMPAELREGIKLGLFSIVIGSLLGHLIYFASPIANLGLRLPDVFGRLPSISFQSRIGSLRAAHSLGLHGLQILMILGAWFAFRAPRLSSDTKMKILRTTFLLIMLVMFGIVIWAVWGIPFASANNL
jgi:hypothetical protein